MQKKKAKVILLGIAIAILIITHNYLTYAPSHQPQADSKIKGIWLTHIGNSGLSYSGLLDKAFHQLAQQNFNTVYVDVYNRGVTYPSKYAPRNNTVSLPLTNPLKTAIQAGKHQGIKVYAWYEYGMMAGLKDGLAKQHPDWLLTTSDGQQYIEQHLWLDPNNPEVRQYFRNLFGEVANKYPNLTGIQLDDHWGIPAVFGNYQQAMNLLTREISSEIRKANPNLVLSLSPNPYSFSLTKYSQNWMEWLKEGLFDELVMQIYRLDADRVRQSTLTSGVKQASNYVTVAIGLYAGGQKQLKTLNEIDKQVETVEQMGYGYSIFCWEYYSISARKLVMAVRLFFRAWQN